MRLRSRAIWGLFTIGAGCTVEEPGRNGASFSGGDFGGDFGGEDTGSTDDAEVTGSGGGSTGDELTGDAGSEEGDGDGEGCPAGSMPQGGDCVDIDECVEGTDDCDPLAGCVNEDPGFACGPCPSGYTDVDGDGTRCEDVDECVTEMDNCDPLAGCTNEVPGFVCGPCPAGYSDANGDGSLCLLVRIGLDDSHGFDADARLGTGARMSDFRAAIAATGAQTQVLSNLDPASLSGLTAVFVQQPYSVNLLTAAQVTGLTSFVQAGGHLVVVGDGGGSTNVANLNTLSQNWGVTYGTTILWGSGQSFTPQVSHPLVAGVASFGVDFAPPMITVDPPAQALAGVGNDRSLAVVDGAGPAGNVVFVSDAFFTNSAGADYNILSLDNAVLLDNIIAFISQ